jgi:hypothetical protein
VIELDELLLKLKKQIETSEAFQDYKDQLKLDFTIEGLRTEMIDDEDRPMFDVGSPTLKGYAELMLKTLGATIAQVPNRVSIAGHTDGRTYSAGRLEYSNWELSADRTNAARRALAQSLPKDVEFGWLAWPTLYPKTRLTVIVRPTGESVLLCSMRRLSASLDCVKTSQKSQKRQPRSMVIRPMRRPPQLNERF